MYLTFKICQTKKNQRIKYGSLIFQTKKSMKRKTKFVNKDNKNFLLFTNAKRRKYKKSILEKINKSVLNLSNRNTRFYLQLSEYIAFTASPFKTSIAS